VSAGPELRAATVADLSALLALERGCDGAPHWSDDAWRGMLAEQAAGERRVIVADGAAQVIGFVVVALVAGVACVESIAVDAALRRQGIARRLIEAAMSWARAHGASAMELEVRASNAAALGLYRRLEFVEQGRRPRYYAAPAEDAVLMAVALG